MAELQQIKESEIFDEKMRLVKSWASVDIRDSDGENIPMGEFVKIMPVIMDRGGMIMDSHSSRPVGKILNYEFAKNPVSDTEGVKLLWKVFDNYSLDDIVWEEIKNGVRKGISFGGAAGEHKFDFSFSKEPTKILEKIEGYEFSSVSEPANQLSLNEEVNFLAKCKFCIDKNKDGENKIDAEKAKAIVEKNMREINKPLGQYNNFADCVSHNKDKNNPEAYCAEIMRNVEEKNKELELKNHQTQDKTGDNNMMTDKTRETEKSAEDSVKILQKEVSELKDAVKSISENVGRILKQNEEDEKPKDEEDKPEDNKKGKEGEEDEEDEDGKDTSAAEEKKKGGEAVTLPKDVQEELQEGAGKNETDKVTLSEKMKEAISKGVDSKMKELGIEIVKAKRPESKSITPAGESEDTVLKIAQNKTQMNWAGIEKIAKGE